MSMSQNWQNWLDRRYMKRTDPRMGKLVSRVSAVETELALNAHRIGRITLPLITLGGTNTQTLTWTQPMPNDAYQVSVQQDAAILGNVTITVLSITAAAVQVRTQAVLAISAGAQLLVIGWYE